MPMTVHTSFIAALTVCLLTACGGGVQPRAYGNADLTADDSLLIRMGQWEYTHYHSDKLDFDIDYPSFLYHQELPSEDSQEVFIFEDVTVSFIVDSLNGFGYSAGQQMMGMGAELIDATDRYSIHTGQEDKWEYYGKVIDDSVRQITVLLRYDPEHAEAVDQLRDWVRDFDTIE